MFYTLSNVALRLLLPLLLRLDVRGLERVSPTGALIVVANHVNWIDPPLLGALLRRRITFMAKREVFETPVLGQIATWYGAFGVRRGEPDHRAIRRALAVLEKGDALGMFPEGTRSKTARLQPGHPGAAMIARRGGAMILPVAISGTEQLRRPLALLRRPAVRVEVGEPFQLPASGDLASATAEIMTRLAGLLPENYRPLPGAPLVLASAGQPASSPRSSSSRRAARAVED